MAHSKTHADIQKEIADAKKYVVVGGTYAHYKHPENLYTVIGLATQEASDKLCVIYRAEYGEKLLFVRDLDDWLEKPEYNGKKVERFTLIKA